MMRQVGVGEDWLWSSAHCHDHLSAREPILDWACVENPSNNNSMAAGRELRMRRMLRSLATVQLDRLLEAWA